MKNTPKRVSLEIKNLRDSSRLLNIQITFIKCVATAALGICRTNALLATTKN